MRKDISLETYKNLVEDCVEKCKNNYCFYKLFLLEQHPDPRIVAQVACIERLKFIKSKDAGKDIGMDKTLEMWIDKGYAKVFAKIYDEEADLTLHKLFLKVLEETEKV